MAANPFDQFDSATTAANPFDQFDGPASKPKGFMSDVGTALKQGVQQLPGALTGLADIPLGLAGMNRPVSRAAERLGEVTGFQPGKWAQETAQQYSPETQAARADIDAAWNDPNAGALDVAGAYLRNPRATALNVVQSMPSIVAGGIAGRVAGLAGLASAPARAALGEGAVMAGQQMDQIDDQVDPQKAALAALGTGAAGAAAGAVGGRVAARMGVRDIDTTLAGGAAAQAARAPGVAGRVASGAAHEAAEEAAQSAVEQGAQNWAEGKDLTAGMARNVVEGALAGGVMGAGAGAVPLSRRMGLDPNAGPLSAAAATAVDTGATLALPAPTVTVDGEGTARTAEQRQAERDAPGPVETGAVGQGRNSEEVPAAAPFPAPELQPALEYSAPPALGYDTAPTDTLIADADGTVRQETRAEAINRAQVQGEQQAAEDAEAQRRADLGMPPLTSVEQVRPGPARGETLELGADGVARPVDLLPQPTNRLRAGRAAREAGPGYEPVQVEGGWNVRRITSETGAAAAPEAARIKLESGRNRDGPAGEPGGLAAGAGDGRRANAGSGLGNAGRAQPGRPAGGLEPAAAGPVARGQDDLAVPARGTDVAVAPRALPAPSTPLDQAAHAAATSPTNARPEPTPAQKEAGNYAKGHLKLHGLDISIENPRGSTRSGTDPNGQPWSVDMPAHYGYVRRTTGADGDQVDVYIGDHPDSPRVFVVDQRDADSGAFDEHKVIMGARNAIEARRLYDAGFSDGRGSQRMGAMTTMSVDEFKGWLKDGDTTTPAAPGQEGRAGLRRVRADRQVRQEGQVPARPVPTPAAADQEGGFRAGRSSADRASQSPASQGQRSRSAPARSPDGGEEKEGSSGHYSERMADPEVSRNAGQRGEGMSEFRARQVQRQLAKANQGTTYTVEEDASLKKGWAVVGRRRRGGDAPMARVAVGEADIQRAQDQHHAEIERAVGQTKGRWRNAPPVVVVANPRSAGVHARVRKHYTQPGAIVPNGSYYGGTAYLFTDYLQDPAEALRVLFHEVLGHAGLRGVFGPALNSVLDQVAAARSEQVRAKAAEYGFDLDNQRQRRMAAEEVLAELAEQNPQLPLVRRAIAAIRTWLRENIPALRGMALSDAEIVRNFIMPARGFIERGPAAERAPSSAVPASSQRAEGDTLAEVRQQWAAMGIENYVSESRGVINLSTIKVPQGERNGGKGTRAMELLAAYADRTGQRIALSPSADFGSSKLRLIRFYKRFGFVENRGRSKDFTISETMIREPAQAPASARAISAAVSAVPDVEKARFLQGAAIADLPGDQAPKGYPALRAWATKLFEDAGGKVTHPVLGDVVLDARAVKDSMGHGMNPFKAEAFAVVPQVLEKGVVVAEGQQGRDGIGYFVSAPVRIAGAEDVVTVLVRRDPNSQRMYLHSVVTKEGLLRARDSGTDAGGGVERSGKVTSGEVASVLRNLLSMKTDGPAGDAPMSSKAAAGTAMGAMSPAQEAAWKRVAQLRQVPTLKERFDGLRANLGTKVRQGVLDQFAPIKEISAEAYMHARLSKGSDGTMEAALLYGRPFLRDGAADVDIKDGGFAQVLASLKGEHDRFLMWVAAQRAERLQAEGKENLFTSQDIGALKTLNAGRFDDGTARTPVYAKALRDLNAFNDSVLAMAEQSGLIDPEARALFKDQPYVPFYRVMEEGDMKGPKFSSGLVNQQAFKKLKGGSQQLNADLLENMLLNWSHLYSAAARNRAAQATMDAAEKLAVAHQVPEGTKGAVRVLRAGVAEHWAIEDPYLLDAVAALHYSPSPLMKPLAAMKNVLTYTVTVNPTFKIRNLIRDSLSAISQADLSYNPLRNVAGGWKATAADSQIYASMLASGGTIRFGTQENSARLRAQVEKLGGQVLDKEGWRKLANQVRTVWSAYEEFGDRVENVNRAALYEQLVKKGHSHAEASFMARDLMDFSLSGAWPAVRLLGQSVPFFNARLQGLYKLGRAAAEDPRRFGTMAAAVSLASLGLMAAYQDDDDWKKREDWDRDAYWWFKVGDTAFRIPKPFELGAIGTIAERSAELLFDDEMTGQRFGKRISDMVFGTFAMDPTPQIIKPLLDVYANKDSFTGRAIEGMTDERLRPQDRAGERTTEVARFLGQLGLPDPVQLAKGEYSGLSPKQIDFLLRGYFGWVGTTAAQLGDRALRPLMDRGERPAMELRDAFVAGNFVESLPSGSSRYVTQLYDRARQVNQAYASYRDALKRGDTEKAAEIREEEGGNLLARQRVNHAKEQLAKINQQARMVEGSRTLSAEQKRVRLDAIEDRRDRVARLASVQ